MGDVGAFVHPPNLAQGKSAKQSSTQLIAGRAEVKCVASKAVDGVHKNHHFSHCTHTKAGSRKPPKWEVDLGKDYKISVIRITGLVSKGGQGGGRINPFYIKIGDTYCTQSSGSREWCLPPGQTGDFTCAQPLVGSKVTIGLQGRARILQLCEVEVYEAFSTVANAFGIGAFNGSTSCYDPNTRDSPYPKMKKCHTCSGPGPTQCTACKPGDAFVPWRKHMAEGSCKKTEKIMQIQAVTNGPVTTLAKWGSQEATDVTLPASNKLQRKNVQTVHFDAQCNVQKAVMCTQMNASITSCVVKKTVSLVSVLKVYLDKDPILTEFAKHVGLMPDINHDGFLSEPGTIKQLLALLNITNPGTACASVTQMA